jgi:hypothetical protein
MFKLTRNPFGRGVGLDHDGCREDPWPARRGRGLQAGHDRQGHGPHHRRHCRKHWQRVIGNNWTDAYCWKRELLSKIQKKTGYYCTEKIEWVVWLMINKPAVGANCGNLTTIERAHERKRKLTASVQRIESTPHF